MSNIVQNIADSTYELDSSEEPLIITLKIIRKWNKKRAKHNIMQKKSSCWFES